MAWKDFEIILVDNMSGDAVSHNRSTGGTADFLRVREAYANGVIKVVYDPIAGNVSARNKGATLARGEYLFFSDAHMSYRPGSYCRMIQTIDEAGGIVHPAVAWMGSYPPRLLYQYSWILGAEFDGRWNDYKVSDQWFYVPAMGHCSLGVRRRQFAMFRGYPEHLRCYGGGGMFLDTKWWMLQSSVVTEPRAVAYHLSASHPYTYPPEDYVYNVIHTAIALGADAWAERVYLYHLRTMPRQVLDKLWVSAMNDAQSHKIFMDERRGLSFNDVIVQRPWDSANEGRYGIHHSGVHILSQKRWLTLIKGTPAEECYPGQYQTELQQLIAQQLSAFEECDTIAYRR